MHRSLVNQPTNVTQEALHTWECLAPFGRFVEIGKADITKNTRLEMQPFERNVIPRQSTDKRHPGGASSVVA
jgi:hypothetical protein